MHRHRHDTDTTTRAHTEAPGTPAQNTKGNPKRILSRWKSQTVVVDRLAASICHGRSRTDTGFQTRSGPQGGCG